MATKRPVEQLKDILPQVISELSVKMPGTQERIQAIWKLILDGKAAKHSAVRDIKKGVLVVHVDSPAWLFQLSREKKKILEEISRDVPEITSIYFKVGTVK